MYSISLDIPPLSMARTNKTKQNKQKEISHFYFSIYASKLDALNTYILIYLNSMLKSIDASL